MEVSPEGSGTVIFVRIQPQREWNPTGNSGKNVGLPGSLELDRLPSEMKSPQQSGQALLRAGYFCRSREDSGQAAAGRGKVITHLQGRGHDDIAGVF